MSLELGRRIIDNLRVFIDPDDCNKHGTELDLSKYPFLDEEDIESGSKMRIFTLESMFYIFFEKQGFGGFWNGKCYEKTLLYLLGLVFGSSDYSQEQHIKDVNETIEYIKSINDS